MIPSLRKKAIATIWVIWRDFFWIQYKARIFPGRIPVTPVDHGLDMKVPFDPSYVKVYLDFTGFWIRTAAFFLEKFGRKGIPHAARFMDGIQGIYLQAAEIYRINLSTTDRPHYYGKVQFFIIHLTDPHLMCIPSLHVMLVIGVWTMLRDELARAGRSADFADDTAAARAHAVAITDSILFVKQHSVNCIGAAMYAYGSIRPALFPETDALAFANDLLRDGIREADAAEIRAHIAGMYQKLLGAYQDCSWTKPLLDFLAEY
jgi:hypothetical protein